MFDLILEGGTIVDGTGRAGFVADLAVVDGRIAAIGSRADAAAGARLNVSGLTVAPGFIDVHTHYDAQIMWDPAVTPSPLHGVTTVIGGNCGFSVAPIAPGDHEYVRQLMAVVEGIPRSALDQLDWNWNGFAEWLDRIDGTTVVNASFLVGHSTLRRAVMGSRAVRDLATTDEITQMAALLSDALAAGALGFSSGWDNVHTDGDGNPVPSRVAAAGEFVALSEVVSRFEGTTLGFFPHMGELPADRMQLMTDMALAARRPLNWNLLGSMSPTEIYEQQLQACDLAAGAGARVVALAVPDYLRLRANTLLDALPAFRSVMALDEAGRRGAVADPAVRASLTEAVAAAAASDFAALAAWDLLEIAEARSPRSEPHVGHTIASVAAQWGVEPVDVLLDLVVVERLPLTVMLPTLVPSMGASEAGWHKRAAIWRDPRVMIGGSDAGAHLDLMCHANYPTVMLSDNVRRRGILSIEEAVRLMTDAPAQHFGLRDRGRVTEGAWADLVVFDASTVGSGPAIARHDLPGGGERLFAESVGIHHVFVNGTEIVRNGELTGAAPGRVLRAGRDTDTVQVSS